jgi:hypothetical protein
MVWLLARRRWRWAAIFCLGALLPVLLFGALDWMTWKAPFASFVAYVKVNVLEGRSAEFGVEGPWWYAARLFERGGIGGLLLIAVACAGWRATWPFLASAVGLLLYLSALPHKEERFVMSFWPYLVVAASGVAGAWLARRPPPEARRAAWIAALLVALVALDGFRGVSRLPWNDRGTLLRDAQAFVARQPDVSGLLVDEYYDGGAYAAFGRDVPLRRYGGDSLPNPIFNYVIAGHDATVREAASAGFSIVRRARSIVVLRRSPVR